MLLEHNKMKILLAEEGKNFNRSGINFEKRDYSH